MSQNGKITPMMQQFLNIKQEYPDCILFFRAGDFYELFYDDAKECSKILNITLTKRGDVPMAGVPFHSVNPYIKKILEANRKIAICEQLEDPKQAKGVVKRGVTQIITPGTIIEDEYLSNTLSSYIASIALPNSKEDNFAVVLLDISTGECITKECRDFKEVKNIIHAYTPNEVLYPEHPLGYIVDNFTKAHSIYSSTISIQRFHTMYATEIIKKHFSTQNKEQYEKQNKNQAEIQSSTNPLSPSDLTQFGANSNNNKANNTPQILQELQQKNHTKSIQALGAVLYYAKALKQLELNYIQDIQILNSQTQLVLESLTLKNLDIITNSSSKNSSATLLGGIDYTSTPFGKRELKKRIISPLTSVDEITKRLNLIELFATQPPQFITNLQKELSQIADIERIVTRISSQIATPKDLKALAYSLENAHLVEEELQVLQNHPYFTKQLQYLEIASMIHSAIVDEPPSHIREYGFIQRGYSQERDELEEISNHSSNYLSEIEASLKQTSQIQTLKIKYNKIFGYFIEIPKSQEHKVPNECILKQTLVNVNRYTTPELKEKEQLILGAKEKLTIIEQELFQALILNLQEHLPTIKYVINEIKEIDVSVSGAYLSVFHNYIKPTFNESNSSTIIKGRNPIVERFVDNFISNDSIFKKRDFCKVITGPNMAGKSTYLRQVALISILAQSGMFVPAQSAELKIYDAIFTRIGANDNLAENESTFMVEMSESAHILNTATKDSLVIFDEIGRGTSTYDGMALAQSIIEFIAKKQTHTLFATHYHELNELEKKFEHICNYRVEVEELDDTITFLHSIKKGGSDNSYGIHVAKLAKMPQDILRRADEILKNLEKK